MNRAGLSDRRGVALVLILWVLVVGATLLSIGVVIALQEQRAVHAGRRLQHAFADADAGLGQLLQRLPPGTVNGLRRSLDTVSVAGTTAVGHPWRGTVRRLGPRLLLLEVSAGRPEGGPPLTGVRSRLGWLVWVRPPDLSPSAALSVGDTAWLGESVLVSGGDSSAPALGCPAGDSAIPGVSAGAVVAAAGAVLEGAPALALRGRADSGLVAADRATFAKFWAGASLNLAGGRLTPTPATVGSVCDQSIPTNWGDSENPLSPCADYWPAIAVRGDLAVSGGSGQGILLVDGDLSLGGGFHFRGIVMTTGILQIEPTATPVELSGAVMAGAVGEATRPVTLVTFRHSKCIIHNALLASGEVVPLPSRGWKQLF